MSDSASTHSDSRCTADPTASNPATATQAQRAWDGSAEDFAYAFRYQYLVTEKDISLPGFERFDIGTHNVLVGSGLRVCRLTTSDGAKVGLVFGIAVASGGLLNDRQRLTFRAEDRNFFDLFDAFVKDLSGRYGVLVAAQGQTRFYCDPVGMIGAVYEPRERRLAASPLLAIDRKVDPHPLYDHDMVASEGARYSLLHTVDAHTRRLNPNCYLDLGTFFETRFWPRDETFQSDPADRNRIYSEIIDTTSFTIGEIAQNFDTVLPISGGQDSRLVIGMAQPHLPKIRQFYTQVHNYASRIDAQIAERVCAALGVPHDVLDWRKYEASAESIADYLKMYRAAAGFLCPPPAELEKGLVFGLQDGRVALRGHQTDLLRAVFHFRPQRRAWNKFGWQIKRLQVVPRGRFDDAAKARFTPDFARWQAGLPENAICKAVDFMFIELHYSATLGTAFPAASRNFFMSPYNSRRMIELSLALDDTYRTSGYAVNDIMWRLNRKLARVPFDSEIVQMRRSSDPDLTEEKVQAARIAQTAERARLIAGDTKEEA